MYIFIYLKATKCPIHVFLKTLIPYSRFSRIYRTDLQDLSAHVFSKKIEMLDVQDLRFPSIRFVSNDSRFSLHASCIYFTSWCCPAAFVPYGRWRFAPRTLLHRVVGMSVAAWCLALFGAAVVLAVSSFRVAIQFARKGCILRCTLLENFSRRCSLKLPQCLSQSNVVS